MLRLMRVKASFYASSDARFYIEKNSSWKISLLVITHWRALFTARVLLLLLILLLLTHGGMQLSDPWAAFFWHLNSHTRALIQKMCKSSSSTYLHNQTFCLSYLKVPPPTYYLSVTFWTTNFWLLQLKIGRLFLSRKCVTAIHNLIFLIDPHSNPRVAFIRINIDHGPSLQPKAYWSLTCNHLITMKGSNLGQFL